MWKKYSSIENTYRTKVLDKIRQYHSDKLYFVQEKCHGSNFSIVANEDGIKAAKRSCVLGEGMTHYNSELMLVKYGKNIHQAFLRMKSVDEIIVYGELYGGTYPHPDVEPVKGVKKIQKGVFYKPDQDFIAFDITLNGEYVDMYTFVTLCKTMNVPFLEPLLVADLETCLRFPNEFQTTIPGLFGLPKIDNNACEGVVIKTVSPCYLPNKQRVVMKNKNETFNEKTGKRPNKSKPKVDTSHIDPYTEVLGQYITENRLRNVISKVGEVTQKDFGMLMGLMSKDCLEDFNKDGNDFSTLEKKDQKTIKSFLNKKVSVLIRSNFQNIIDGEF